MKESIIKMNKFLRNIISKSHDDVSAAMATTRDRMKGNTEYG